MITSMLFFPACSQEVGGFRYLQLEGEVLKSTHQIKLSLKIPDGFSRTEDFNYRPIFNNQPFNVSTAAVYDENRIIMVHAEALPDSSGYIDYSYLDTINILGIDFYTKESCVVMSEELLSNAKDLQFFQSEGFDFYPAIYLNQFFLDTEDGNAEYVLSYGERVSDCSQTTIDQSFKDRFFEKLKSTLVFEEYVK
jgi:hypothetical protein